MTPALFIRMCTAGTASAILAAASRTPAKDVRSTMAVVTRASSMVERSRCSVSLNPSLRRAANTTWAPADDSARADSLPRPDVAPVITHTLSVRSLPSTTSIAVGRPAVCALNEPSLRR
jgi:hypothetical protein